MTAPDRAPDHKAALASAFVILLEAHERRINRNRPPSAMASLETEKPGANPASRTTQGACDDFVSPNVNQ